MDLAAVGTEIPEHVGDVVGGFGNGAASPQKIVEGEVNVVLIKAK